MTRETCSAAWWPSFFLASLNRGGEPGSLEPPESALPPPQTGIQFFRFRKHLHRKAPVSEAGAAYPTGSAPPNGKS